MSKIVIVDDNRVVVWNMKCAATEAGHLTFGIGVTDPPDPQWAHLSDIQMDLQCRDLDAIVAAILEFQPDLVFLDHDLGMGPEKTGAYLAERIRLPKERLVGSSGSYSQRYCSRSIDGKDRIRDTPSSEAKERFIALLGQ